MIDTAELGRKMMSYAKNLDSDVEFNNWCRLAPKLIGMGLATHPKNLKEFSYDEQVVMARALTILIQNGEIVLKR
jgi:hypothetical protein